MVIITRKLLVLLLLIFSLMAIGQEQVNDSISPIMKEKIDKVIAQEKEAMKEEVEAVNVQLDNKEISLDDAIAKKKEIANKYALRIQRRVELVKAGKEVGSDKNGETKLTLNIGGGNGLFVLTKNGDTIRRKDKRTYSDIVLAFGFNNAIGEGQTLNDLDYKVGGSRFFELGFAWRTRVFKNSNWLRFKYGVSLQYNNLKLKDNKYYVKDGDLTTAETFPHELDKSKIRFTNLVAPIHFEFGPSKKIERDTYFRYSTRKKFKVGLGGYAGIRIGTRQKLKYKVDGDREKDKIKSDFNANDFVYGLSGYVSWGSVGIYTKYDLNPLFASPNIKQHNVSLGLRFDMD
ncbi:hypothetical protein ACFQ1O_05800 [Pseudofulvibacter geojedonensis]|uniref:Outer membrane protein beta-barrel domain-containing protein n=2 Tax=Pseudofulvibacter geojedonensis TaxID=1123758 RepID=A0ABW3I134_9FLAO